jgi:acyl-CoA thioesterase FadM
MNLILRLLRVLAAAVLGRRRDLMDESVVAFRVWPNDLDINLHMNNGRYLTVMDLGRMDMAVRAGLLRAMLRERWMPVLGGATVRFRRPLAPFRRYLLRTRILCWDEKWVYFEHRFETRGGHLACHAIVKGLFLARGASVPPAEILRALGRSRVSPPMPPAVAAWMESERELRDRSQAA